MDNPERLFICRLALALGKSLYEVAAMPLPEFTTWAAYYELEPWGCPVEDERSRNQLTLFYSAYRASSDTPIPTFYDRWKLEEKTAPEPESHLHNKIKGYFKAYAERQNKNNPA